MSRRSAAALVALHWNQHAAAHAAHVHIRIRFADLAKLTSHKIQSRGGPFGTPRETLQNSRATLNYGSTIGVATYGALLVRAPTHCTPCERLQENVESELQPFADPRRKLVLGWFTGFGVVWAPYLSASGSGVWWVARFHTPSACVWHSGEGKCDY